jgi:SNF2 family DNA or RNA helicase
MSHASEVFKLIKEINDRVLTEGDPIAAHPGNAIRIPLHQHQLCVLKAMERLEKGASTGIDCSGERLFTNYGILGDSVGAGKSLMVLSHIASLHNTDTIQKRVFLGADSSKSMFTLKERAITDCSEANAIIIVPHTLFRQWAAYIKEQTSLKAVYVDKRQIFKTEHFTTNILSADVVLVSNTMYKDFCTIQEHNKIKWRRAFIDEADTIYMTNGYPFPNARFTWFITATWVNLIFPQSSMYVSNVYLNDNVFNPNGRFYSIRSFFSMNTIHSFHSTWIRFYISSLNAFSQYMNFHSKLRGHVVIKCSEEFVQKSIQLPPLYKNVIACRSPINHSIVDTVVSQDIREMLHGGDISGAIVALGVKTDTTTNIVKAVTENLEKELDRLKATLAFKSGLDYSSPSAKAAALEALEEKIKTKSGALQDLRQRVENYKEELCPICFDEPAERLLTPCCTRIFCAQCILLCLSHKRSCPLCRAAIHAPTLKHVVDNDSVNRIVDSAGVDEQQRTLERKEATLMRLLTENPTGKFLIFSRYDNTFVKILEDMQAKNIGVKQLKGSMDSIAATLRQFEAGQFQCLLLNSQYAGSGLNITAATHVVLMHAMTHAEEKQILGRAYRAGREGPLHMYKLLYENELSNAD